MSTDKTSNCTGPRTPEGKARSRMNALKSGIYAKAIIIRGEDPAELDALTTEYFEHHQPDSPEKRCQLELLVQCEWHLRRLSKAGAQFWEYQMDRAYKLSETAPLGHALHEAASGFERIQRMMNAQQRNYQSALRELTRLESEDQPPPAPEPEPTAQPQPNSVQEPQPDPAPEFVPSPASPNLSPQAPGFRPTPVSERHNTPDFVPPDFHKPGSACFYLPHNPKRFKRCPICYPDMESYSA